MAKNEQEINALIEKANGDTLAVLFANFGTFDYEAYDFIYEDLRQIEIDPSAPLREKIKIYRNRLQELLREDEIPNIMLENLFFPALPFYSRPFWRLLAAVSKINPFKDEYDRIIRDMQMHLSGERFMEMLLIDELLIGFKIPNLQMPRSPVRLDGHAVESGGMVVRLDGHTVVPSIKEDSYRKALIATRKLMGPMDNRQDILKSLGTPAPNEKFFYIHYELYLWHSTFFSRLFRPISSYREWRVNIMIVWDDILEHIEKQK